MTNLAQPESAVAPVRINIHFIRVAVALALAALADWLFYDQYVGISLVIFAIVLAACSLATNQSTLERRRLLAGLIFVAGLVPAIEDLNALSFGFILLALGVAAAMLTNPGFDGLASRAAAPCANCTCSLRLGWSATPSAR